MVAAWNCCADAEADDDHEEGAVALSHEERTAAGVETERVERRSLRHRVVLPAEVVVNGYRSARVTPKITSVVEARHVRLGDAVEAGQRLASLSSVAMAEAAGELMLAAYEWRLVRELGSEAVSGRRYAEAQTAQRKAMAKVQAYGLTESQAHSLAASDDASAFSGVFDMLAPRAGTVFSDDFVVGELVEPGRVLFEIVDESSVWVEARAAELPDVEAGAEVDVVDSEGRRTVGRVVQRHHRLDESTRTQGLRIEVDNVDDALHPGQFVEVELATGATGPVLAVPKAAVTLIDGRENVFRLEDEEFHAVPVATRADIGEWVVIEAGLEPGDDVATSGVFHLKSLLLKSSLGSGHAH
ncbi:MAG: efflux RND transporter periplasmic adaptor subunit [Gammaproteobacteria bacterium]|nr:efflux RND transporter periplasmic adaptor subunit [Gammaproteobacteria bacterium]